jgi:hypothetical protein
MNPAEQAAWDAYAARQRKRVALHETAHVQVAVALGARGRIEARVDQRPDHGGHVRIQRPAHWTPVEAIAWALAGRGAELADAGIPMPLRLVEDVLEMEHEPDLVRMIRNDPSLAEEGLKLSQRIVWELLDSIRRGAGVLEDHAGERVDVDV